MAHTVLPVEFSSVAGTSMIVLIIMMVPTSSGEKPKTEQIISSPVIPPLGIAPMTAPTKNATLIMAAMFMGSLISLWNSVNRNTILMMPPMTEPSLWVLAPKGITVSAISSGTPIFFVATRLAGIQAALDDVATAVIAGVKTFDQKTLTPSYPPATKAYSVFAPKK